MITVILFIALGVFLFSMDRSWSNVVSARRNDLVFEGRNLEYGAYAIRKEHHMNVFYALLISVGLIGGGLFAISALRTPPAPPILPPHFDPLPLVDFKQDEVKKPEEKEHREANAGQRPAGVRNNQYVITEDPDVEPVAALDSLANKPIGDGGELPAGVVMPYDPGDGGSGTGTVTTTVSVDPAPGWARIMPVFPGGAEALLEYVGKRVHYSEQDIDRGTEGTIYMSFVVDENGGIRDVVVERNIANGEQLARRATNVLLSMPRWTPGSNGNGPISVRCTMPLSFKLKR